MKTFIKNFKNFLLESKLDDYNLDGTTHLYHYSKSDDDELTLDPEHFVSNTSSHSRKEKEVSDVPRIFFYADPNKTEQIILTQFLFICFVHI